MSRLNETSAARKTPAAKRLAPIASSQPTDKTTLVTHEDFIRWEIPVKPRRRGGGGIFSALL